MAIRILISDDHGVLRAALRALLNREADMEVVGEAADSEETLRLAGELQPDVLLLDLSMPGPGGLEVTRALRERAPAVRVLVLTVHEDESLVREAIQAGAAGYIIKRAYDTELTSAVRAVAHGDLYIHPALTWGLLKGQDAPASSKPDKRAGDATPLTRREMDVLVLLAKGYTNKQIGEALALSVRTVETHRANLMGKLGVANRVELVRYAKEHNLLDTH